MAQQGKETLTEKIIWGLIPLREVISQVRNIADTGDEDVVNLVLVGQNGRRRIRPVAREDAEEIGKENLTQIKEKGTLWKPLV